MIFKVKYRLYHSKQDKYRHAPDSKWFIFAPDPAFKPMGIIIFEPGNARVESLRVRNEEQLVVRPVPADMFAAKSITLKELDKLETSYRMQSILRVRGMLEAVLPTVELGDQLTIILSEPVGTVAFWGIEQAFDQSIPRNISNG